MTSSDDSALVAEARAGSQEATAELFRRHWTTAWRAALAIVGSPAAAEDVAQEAFVRAIGALGRFDNQRPFAVWLHRIVVNRAIDHLRRERRHARLEDAADSGYDGTPSLADPELGVALGRLTLDRRIAVVLRYGLDYRPDEIAEVLDIPLGTVHSRLARALAELRTMLEVGDVKRP